MCGINSNDTNNSISINNIKICAYPENAERNIMQTKDSITWELLLPNNIKKPFHELLHQMENSYKAINSTQSGKCVGR